MNTECNLTGKRIGKLVVTEKCSNDTNGFALTQCNTHWKCKCDCGNEKITTTYHLTKRRPIKSCGCAWYGYNRRSYGHSYNHPSYKGLGDMPGTYYSGVKRAAKLRNIEFNVSKEYLWALFLQQDRKCALSGLELQFRHNQHVADGTASLDRIDSSRGYVEGNVQWIHKEINFMKQAKTDDYFIKMCNLITANVTKKYINN